MRRIVRFDSKTREKIVFSLTVLLLILMFTPTLIGFLSKDDVLERHSLSFLLEFHPLNSNTLNYTKVE
jgi:hypothetical protein